jgi:hypothetical protein
VRNLHFLTDGSLVFHSEKFWTKPLYSTIPKYNSINSWACDPFPDSFGLRSLPIHPAPAACSPDNFASSIDNIVAK